jgi:phage baseplate assembly protein W
MFEQQLKSYESAISLPFRITPQGSIAKAMSQSEVWQDRVKTGINTRLGERVMFSRFGTDIANYEWSTVSDIENVVITEVENLFTSTFPTLTLDQVTVEYDEINNRVLVDVEYSTPNLDKLTNTVGMAVVSGNLPIYEENR